MEITTAADSHVPEIVEIWKEFSDFHKNDKMCFRALVLLWHNSIQYQNNIA